MLFQGENNSLKLDVFNYELPADGGDPTSDDRNWLILRATYVDEDGDITKDSNSCLLTYELQEMTAGLKVLDAGIRDRYESSFTEPYFTLTAQAEGEGFLVEVSFFLPNTMDGDDTAEVAAHFSKADMRALLDELDKLCKKFPDRT
ncbi:MULTISPECIES: hypothetical protein [environmental samples]|jgi:hypothetical protein|uniref:WapI family immunity protein n=1 Tax=environmental samples TaxID=876090 RepID=UPI000339FFDA|nr:MULTISPECIES: hypothetical protein [environmental samples]CDC71531.1 putative uncharacterized protein [Oscillibacter sp. CAG:155]